MARKQRIHYPGALYHVILRGNAQQDIFIDDSDRRRFYLLLQEGIEKFGYRIHAYCLMTNHIHLVVQVGETPLSRIMQNISLRYTTWINRRMNRTGHLFQGRYKAVLVDADSYLLELVAYIHLNPLRTCVATDPGDYPWSSHRAYFGQETLTWLTTDQVLAMFGSRRDRAARYFAKFIEDRMGVSHKDEFHRGGEIDSRILGEERFVDEAMEKAQMRRELKPTIGEALEAVKKICGIDDKALCSRQRSGSIAEARTLAAWAVLEFSDGTISEVGRFFGRDVSTLSACIRRLTDKAENDLGLADRMELVKQELLIKATKQA